ncbi:type II toxin-antitoxin system HicB family antitoxin [Pediococcus inopinatus]|jgi:predicted RNase H-like HicB family nuclease|uniref:Type II toxin-antitoxin system HicB family antitoxin n=1 Tax=Pediococcus inopinatus TaxID=114090 RepID=A0ABZ0Q719_9LACO|nr:hypothetical protein [Pediococcus inopinatus]WPC20240.1 type II toxin-antitoxin system HicB family antitoxin [Pediococcus inopinatus]WPC21945.1 type II toxin-antitoxin system HicB family antitoxin [Pediococcus inopinatus]WPP09124.1 type II toxin-antitoxin system HicB family antitoxin [Pediococcus inopinatus]
MQKKHQNLRAAYPVIISHDKPDLYLVHIVDFNSDTSGTTLSEAIEMARDALSEEGLARQDAGLSIPEPSFDIEHPANTVVTYVDIDLAKYRKLSDNRTVKKTITIPSYLNELGREQDINFSETMTIALKEKLGV